MESKKIGDVSSSLYTKVGEISREKIKKELTKLSESKVKDEFELSSIARRISEYVKIIESMPGIREDKIKEIKEKLASGEYKSKQVLEETAKKIVDDIL